MTMQDEAIEAGASARYERQRERIRSAGGDVDRWVDLSEIERERYRKDFSIGLAAALERVTVSKEMAIVAGGPLNAKAVLQQLARELREG